MLTQILDIYNENNINKELEIRFQNISKDDWISIYNKSTKSDCIENKSISFINDNNIKYSNYNGTSRTSTSYIRKRILKYYKHDNYKISLSEEIPIQPFNVNNGMIARMRIRTSCDIGKWRLDMTIVIHFNDIQLITKEVINKYFSKDGIRDIVDAKYEIEVEHIDKNSQVTESDIESIIASVNSDELVIKNVLLNLPPRYIGKPKPLTKPIYKNIFELNEEYYVTTKIDGINVFCVITNDELCYVFDANYKFIRKTKIGNMNSAAGEFKFPLIVNGEMIDDGTIFISDILIPDLLFIERYSRAKYLPFLKEKPQYKITEFTDKINSLLSIKPQDGLILTKNTTLQYQSIYKYKDKDHLTIDFTIYKDEGGVYNLLTPISVTLLNALRLEQPSYFDKLPKFNNGTYVLTYFQPFIYKIFHSIHIFKPKDKQDYHNKVGEFKYVNGEWIFVTFRSDKYYGNDYRIANILFSQIFNPIDLKFLKNPILDSYFRETVDAEYHEHTKFVASVRRYLYNQFNIRSPKSVLILCCGKGQELFLAQSIGADNVVYVDNDIDALETLIERIYGILNVEYYPNKKIPNKFPKNYVMKLDLQSNYDSLIKEIGTMTGLKTFDAIIINLGIHYILTSESHYNNFIKFIDATLNKNGIFLFTCYNGNKLFNMLQHIKEYKQEKNNKILYHIKPNYDLKKKQLDFSCTIDVLLPFSIIYYKENLVDINKLIIDLVSRGYDPRQYGPITNYLSLYNRNISDDNIDYSSLYYYVSLYKT